MKNNSCLVIGGDGYMGWPLVVELAFQTKFKKIVILDSLLTRRNVKKVNGNSINHIEKINTRVKELNKFFKRKKIFFIKGSTIEKKKLENLIRKKFNCIYHLGHQRTAPYSMLNQESSVETIINNEVGFMNLIWSIKKYSRESLLIKLGSFGAYAPSGIVIPEEDEKMIIGKYRPKIKLPFPKMSTDFYHITKANDGLYARSACHNWGLRIIDVMQSTVFGLFTKNTKETNLLTRYDYDQIFGTVLNRFICQGISGHKLTVYGGGNHSTGIMCLRDSINFLTLLGKIKLTKGQYKVVNANPYSFKIKTLAEKVKKQLLKYKIKSSITTSYDPRYEKKSKNIINRAECRLLFKNIKITDIENEIYETVPIILKNKKRINKKVIAPTHKW